MEKDIFDVASDVVKQDAETTAVDEAYCIEHDTVASSGKSEAGQNEPKGFAYEIFSLLHDVIYILSVVTIVFVFVVRLVGVDGESMLPTLHNRDYVLLESNFLYGADDVKTGDIVVLTVPYYKDQGPIVKRVIATEGQTVYIDFEEGVVYVDGVMLEEDFTNTPTNINWDPPYSLEYPATVPEDCVFVLGDNRNGSTDSRFAPVGMIDKSCILGKVFMVLLPGQTRDAAGNITDARNWSRFGAVS